MQTVKNKIKLCSLIIAVIMLFCGCHTKNERPSLDVRKDKIRCIWISYSELNGWLKAGDFRVSFESAVENCVSFGITDIFVHIRAFGDSIYPSAYFPLTKEASAYDFDLLSFITEASHTRGVRVHAWINPYRIRLNDENIETLPDGSPAKLWLTDDNLQNDNNVSFSNGIYLNPSSGEVMALVINGIREILEKYEVDGIHFDDYFYPTSSEEFDRESYKVYTEAAKSPLALSDWRESNVNALISGCYSAVKHIRPDSVFSISPAASIEHNRTELFADVEEWVENGYVDWIIPQLYFGFDYPLEEYRFQKLLSKWSALSKWEDVRLIVGLAPYKIGTESQPDKEEWNRETDILLRQSRLCDENPTVFGTAFFSYSSLFSDAPLNNLQRENLITYYNE